MAERISKVNLIGGEMAKGEGASVDAMIQNLVQDRMRGERERTEDLPPLFNQITDPGPIDDEEKVAEAFSKIASDEGFYVKIYRKHPVPKEYGGRPLFLLDIPQPENIDDWESELLSLAQKYGWPDGLYEYRLFQRGVPGVRAVRRMALQVPKLQPPFLMNPPGENGHSKENAFQQLKETASFIKELSDNGGEKSPSVAPEKMLSAVTEAYRAGLTAAQNGSQDFNPIDFIRAAKELAPPPAEKADGPSVPELIRAIGSLFQSQNQKSGSEEDFLDKMIKMKQAGLLGSEKKEEDPLDRTVKMLTAFQPFIDRMGGGSGETSVTLELIRLLAPQAGQIVENVASTLNNAIALKAGQLAPISLPTPPPPGVVPNPSGSLPSPPSQPFPSVSPYDGTGGGTEIDPSRPGMSLTGITGPQPSPEVFQGEKQEVGMNSFFKKLQEAIQTNNSAFFPDLRDTFRSFSPDNYNAVVDGEVGVEVVQQRLALWGGSFFICPEAKAYFENLIAWIKAQEVQAKCASCGEEVIYDSKEHLVKDNTCPSCNGTMEVSNG